MSRELLRGIQLTTGTLRSLSQGFHIQFEYPIAAIAGRNGSGKSTVLALVACAFHNESGGFNPRNRKNSYYTFSDFLIQTKDEVPPDGICVDYTIASEKWEPSEDCPDGRGILNLPIEKKKNGRWTNYDRRFNRDVIFFGVERVVPHYEKTVSKSYRRSFSDKEAKGWESEVAKIVGEILGKNYSNLRIKEHSRHSIPVVTESTVSYSGFNMGAGENALFDIFSVILSAKNGLLIVIDEIELGLHEEAQRRFVECLKRIAHDKKHQIVATTHSSTILDSLPPEARIFLEKSTSGVRPIPKISSAYATGKMSGKKISELDIFVEDSVAKEIIELSLGADFRSRVSIKPIGSATAVIRQLSSVYLENSGRAVAVILDGDQSTKIATLTRNFQDNCECSNQIKKDEAKNWLEKKLIFLPGTLAPEKWVLNSQNDDSMTNLADEFGINFDELKVILNSNFDEHSEFFGISNLLHLPEDNIRSRLIYYAVKNNPADRDRLTQYVKEQVTAP